MNEYEVSWTIEVSANTPEQAARQVDEDYIRECESGSWTYSVINTETQETKLITVVK